MIRYEVSIEIEGKLVPVGMLSGRTADTVCFSYYEEYRKSLHAQPISVSLPLTEGNFSSKQTRNFFEGLLPEGFVRRNIAQLMRVEENDYVSILHGLGQECLGAVRITDDSDRTESWYEEISMQKVRELAREGVTRSVQMVANAHLSLTGASGKAGLYCDEETDKWYLPHGMAPSTHIVKQSHVRLNRIVANEQLSMLTAKKCGLVTPYSFIVNTGKGQDEDILFAIRRYDRVLQKETDPLYGVRVPLRLHQEDFAQAMSVPPSRKYETGHDGYLQKMFSLIRTCSSDPIADQMRLWDAIVFDCLIGNTDAHLKNYSFLYGADLKEKRLSPVYDIVSTTVYQESTRHMAVRIGGRSLLDDITESSFREAAGEAGIGEKLAMRRFDSLCGKFEDALTEAVKEMKENGFDCAEEIAQKILQTGGFRQIV